MTVSTDPLNSFVYLFKNTSMKNFLLSILLLSCNLGSAQTFEWVAQKQVKFSFNPSMPHSILRAAGNGQCWSVSTDSGSTIYGSELYGIVSLDLIDAGGNLVTTHRLGPEVSIYDIAADQNGKLYVAGSFMGTNHIDQQDSLLNTGIGLNTDPFLICFNANGTIKWKRNLGGGLGSATLHTLAVAPSGEAYFSLYNFTDASINHLDSAGNSIGQIVIDGVRGIGDFCFDPWGNLYVTGPTQAGTFSIGNYSATINEPYAIYITRLNASGQVSWAHFGHDVTFQMPSVVADGAGNAYIAGDLMDSLTWGNHHLSGPDWVYDFWLTKVDSLGNFLWAKEGPNPVGSITGDFQRGTGRSVACDLNGNVMLAGNLRGSIDWGNGVTVTNPVIQYSNLHVVLFDAAGNAQWAKNVTDSSYANMNGIIEMDGDLYFSASHNGPGNLLFDTINVNFNYPQNTLVAKIDAPAVTGIDQISETTNANIVFPNPAHTMTMIPSDWLNNSPIALFSIDGKLLKSYVPVDAGLDVSGFPAGLYLLKNQRSVIKLILY